MNGKKDNDGRIRIRKDVYQKVGHAAIDAGKSKSAWIVEAILEKLERQHEGDS